MQGVVRGSKHLQAKKRAGSRRLPPAPRCSGRKTHDFLLPLAVIFFFLGFKFCCMVLRVAKARALIIDLRRLCYFQLITAPN